MKQQIEVTTDRTYTGKKESWTEKFQDSFILESETTFAHKSSRKIKAFQAGVITCVYSYAESDAVFNAPEKRAVSAKIISDLTESARPDNSDDCVYSITLPKGTKVLQYGVNELRFIMPIDAKIYFLGKQGVVRVSDAEKFPYETRVYGGKNINVWTKQA